ncbi:MAG: FGGY family carbohydrate kinase [Natronospirillum sp.]
MSLSTALQEPVIAVLDIGKTNVKLCAIRSGHHGGEVLAEKRQANRVIQGAPYPHIDTEGIWQWMKDSLAEIARLYYVQSIAITTHGATAACMRGDTLALPILDYESEWCQSLADEYHRVRPPFAQTGSPTMAVGLNLGAQLFWLSRAYRQAFSNVTDILTYPQYWGWRLSGIKASEATSLGCHTDLWNPHTDTYSDLVHNMGWTDLFPPLRETGGALGTLHPALAQELGLPEDCTVGNGIHDSNASLVPHLLTRSEPFTVISSGTWTVICGVGADLDNLTEADDMLINVNAYGRPVPTIRFMGGREWETLRGADDATLADLSAVMQQNIFALPSFVNQGGPFRHHHGRLVGPAHSLNGAEKTALASVYCALMTDYCLDRLNNQGDVVVEGAFARNPIYMQVLANLRGQNHESRPAQRVYSSADSTGTTQGTAMLGQDINHWPIGEAKREWVVEISNVQAYADAWRELVEMLS